MPCTLCEALPPVAMAGTLYLAAPLGHTTGRLRAYATETGLPVADSSDGLIVVRVEGADALDRLVASLRQRLSSLELRDTKCLLLETGVTPGMGDLMRMETLGALCARVEGRWLTEMIAEGRLTSHFQPIVRASAPSEVFAYEVLLRGVGRDGELVPPGRMLETAREANLLFQVDRVARQTAIRQASRHGITTHLFINFVPTAIYDPAFCLRTTVEEVERTAIAPERVVFEVVESDHVPDPEHLGRIVRFYRERGFRIALDDVGSGYSSLNLLPELQPDFVKIDMGLIRGVDHDPWRATIAAKLLELAHSLGIRTVAEGVETRGELDWLVEHGADLVQGWLLGRPAAPPPLPTILD